MLFRRVKSHGLAHHSYFIADGNEALVVDPRRDVDVYVELAQRNECRIRWILETHRNEDYVIGSTALAAFTGAEIVHSHRLDFGYGTSVAEGDRLEVGRLRVKVLETPGHTPESLSFALADTSASQDAVMAFTGDALFVGDTGRTDLLGVDRQERLAAQLYQSLFDKILRLGDGVVLCPAHGGGSVCGGHISDRDQSTLGFERLFNPSLNVEGRDQFIQAKLAEKLLKPPYFMRMEEWNLSGNAPIYERLPVPPPLVPDEMAERMHEGCVVVDTRMPQAFAGGHIPGSYNIWLDGLSAYLGWVVSVDKRFALVLPEHADVEQVTRTLLRIGFDRCEGYLRGGFESWQNQGREVERLGTIDTHELRTRVRAGEDITIVDVRKPGEWEQGTVAGAKKIFVGDLERSLDQVPRDRPVVTMCSVGHRGGVGASILRKNGFTEVFNYLGGFTAWTRTGS